MQGFVEPRRLAIDVFCIHELGFDADAELMTAVPGKPETFAIICDDFDCHWGVFGCVRATKSPSVKTGGLLKDCVSA